MADVICMAEAEESVALPPEFSEDALARRFTTRYGNVLRYVDKWGRWYRWNGRQWVADDTQAVLDLARKICRSAAAEALKIIQPEASAKRIANQIASAKTIAAVLKLASADRIHAATTEQWDSDLWLLNTLGGIVDLRNGTLLKHDPAYFMTKIAPVSPAGDCPIWKQFLHQITKEDEALIEYLRRKAGYCLTGITKEHDLDFFYGTGGNGKGTFLNTLTAVMGDYAAVANVDSFTVSNNSKHPTDLAMLRGARLVTAQETEEGQRWSESKIKALTGGDPITARYMRQDFFTYNPQFKLIIAGNHKPRLRNVDEAIRRRLHLVPFTVKITTPDKDLKEKLKAEWSGILQWAIEGAKAWADDGLTSPDSIRAATTEYFAAEDAIENWISELCILSAGYTTTMTDLFQSWQQWCGVAGEDAGSMKRLSQNLRDKHPELLDWQCPVTRRKGFRGIQAVKETPAHWSNDQ